ncbi:unnamed protein product [Coffea canephora]|uniref:DUF3511 domain-containing protein n=1 Tax=Coffea canephora TaxID=49390 RepID=A0A068VII0_COFCA|nr:unnamed protein product [Coffea canephora]
MGEHRPSFGGRGGSERRVEIVSGRGFNQEGVYAMSRPHDHYREAESKPPRGFGDAEMKRRKRIAKYKVYSLEGRVKASIKDGLRWLKNKCSEIIHGY